MKILAGWLGIIVSVCLLLLTVAAITFAQVVPAMVTFTLALSIGLFSIPAVRRTPGEPRASEPTGVAAVTRVVANVLAAVFVYAAVMQLFGARFVVARYAVWQYPFALRWIVGGVELIAAVALLVPRIVVVGASMLIPILVGAIYTLLFRGSPPLAVVPAILLLMDAFVWWEESAVRKRWVLARASSHGHGT